MKFPCAGGYELDRIFSVELQGIEYIYGVVGATANSLQSLGLSLNWCNLVSKPSDSGKR